MGSDSEYRRYAAEAQGWVDRAKSEEDRAAWLRVVLGWLSLIRKPPQTKHQRFDQTSREQGTGQTGSDKSH